MRLNEQQQAIVNTLGGRVAVVAGAGAGKTSTTIELIQKLYLKDGIPLEKFFVATFTNKAGRDLKVKLSKKLGVHSDALEKLWIGTFHSLGFRYLTQIKKLKLNIILPVEATHYLKNIYKQVIQDEGVAPDLVAFKDVMESIEKKRNNRFTWEHVSSYPEICSKVHEIYQKEKTEQDLVDFNDILFMFAQQLKKDDLFSSKFSWVFCDEVQDNNITQIDIANMLTNENAVFVGDSKQCWEANELLPILRNNKYMDVTAENVHVGDQVKSLQGHRHLNYFNITEKKVFNDDICYRVVTESGKIMTISKDHLCLVNLKTKDTLSKNKIIVNLVRLSKNASPSSLGYRFDVFIEIINPEIKLSLKSINLLFRKLFKNYKDAYICASEHMSLLQHRDYDVIYSESLFFNNKRYGLEKIKDIPENIKTLVSHDGKVKEEKIVKIQVLKGNFKFVSLEVAETGLICSSSGIISHNSIYGFRGAAPHLFKEMAQTADRVYPLAYNYRSTPQIINFANVLLDQMPEFKDQKLIATRANGSNPVFILCDNSAWQCFIAIKEDIRRGIPLDEIAVLSRSVKPVTIQSLQILLRRDKIPYTVRGGNDKLNAPFIQNYLSVLKSVVKPTKVSLVNAMSLLPAVGPKTAMRLAESVVLNEGDFNVLKGMSAKYAQTKAFDDYLYLNTIKENNKELLLKGLDFLFNHHLISHYGKKDSSEPSNKKNIIFDVLYEYLLGFKTVSEGIDSLYINEDDEDADKGKVVISTIHQCVTRETIVETPKGLLEIGDIAKTGFVATPFGSKPYFGKFKKNKDIIFKIKTKKGYSLNASPEHGVSVWDNQNFVRKKVEKVRYKDIIRLKLGETISVQTYFTLHNLISNDVPVAGCATPNLLKEDLGELLGILTRSGGTMYSGGLRIIDDKIEVINRAAEILVDLFGCFVKRGSLNETISFLEVDSTFLSKWFLGFEELFSNIPRAILQSPISVQKKFIKGFFDGAVKIRKGTLFIDTKCFTSILIKKLQVMLLRMNIVSTIMPDKKDKNGICMLSISGLYRDVFDKEIGLRTVSKLTELEKSNFVKVDQDIIPFSIAESEIFRGKFETLFDWLSIRLRGYLGREKIKKLYEKTKHPLLLEKLSWHYERVAKIDKDLEETFCVEVPEGNRFLQNGVDGWNSKGLEWESVHILNMNEFGIPFLKDDDEKDKLRLEEEFCVAYVACTRAISKLRMYMQFMSGSYSWAKPNKISRYIKEIYKVTQEKYFTFRVLDVDDEAQYKLRLYQKINESKVSFSKRR